MFDYPQEQPSSYTRSIPYFRFAAIVVLVPAGQVIIACDRDSRVPHGGLRHAAVCFTYSSATQRGHFAGQLLAVVSGQIVLRSC